MLTLNHQIVESQYIIHLLDSLQSDQQMESSERRFIRILVRFLWQGSALHL